MYQVNRSRIIKHDIASLPWEEVKDEATALEFVARYHIKKAWSWLGGQLLAHLGKYKLPERDENGLYDGTAFMRLNVGKDPREMGIWTMLHKLQRSHFMGPQTEPEHIQVCALVPIYLAAQKKFNGVPYEVWTNLQHVVDRRLYEAMLAPELPAMTKDEIMEVRAAGLKDHSPVTYHSLIGIGHTPIGKLPKLAQCMVTQIWCAHPANRHEFMILDPYNWDNMPEKLVDDATVKVELTPPVSQKLDDIPW